MRNLARQPVALVGVEERVISQHLLAIARRLEHDRGDVELVDADVEDRVVELARDAQRPEVGAERDHLVRRFRRRGFGTA